MQNGVRRRFDFMSKRDLLEAVGFFETKKRFYKLYFSFVKIKSLGKPSKNTTKSVSTSATIVRLLNYAYLPAYKYTKLIFYTEIYIYNQL